MTITIRTGIAANDRGPGSIAGSRIGHEAPPRIRTRALMRIWNSGVQTLPNYFVVMIRGDAVRRCPVEAFGYRGPVLRALLRRHVWSLRVTDRGVIPGYRRRLQYRGRDRRIGPTHLIPIEHVSHRPLIRV